MDSFYTQEYKSPHPNLLPTSRLLQASSSSVRKLGGGVVYMSGFQVVCVKQGWAKNPDVPQETNKPPESLLHHFRSSLVMQSQVDCVTFMYFTPLPYWNSRQHMLGEGGLQESTHPAWLQQSCYIMCPQDHTLDTP